MDYDCVNEQNNKLKLIEVKILLFNLCIHIQSAHLMALFSFKLCNEL